MNFDLNIDTTEAKSVENKGNLGANELLTTSKEVEPSLELNAPKEGTNLGSNENATSGNTKGEVIPENLEK